LFPQVKAGFHNRCENRSLGVEVHVGHAGERDYTEVVLSPTVPAHPAIGPPSRLPLAELSSGLHKVGSDLPDQPDCNPGRTRNVQVVLAVPALHVGVHRGRRVQDSDVLALLLEGPFPSRSQYDAATESPSSSDASTSFTETPLQTTSDHASMMA
jgi:hypothetical protein